MNMLLFVGATTLAIATGYVMGYVSAIKVLEKESEVEREMKAARGESD